MGFSEEKQAAVQAQIDTGRFTDDELYKLVLDGAKKGYSFAVPAESMQPEAPAAVPSFVQEQPQMAPMPAPAPIDPGPAPTIADPMMDQQDVPMGAPIATYTGGFAPELASPATLAPAMTQPGIDPVVGDASVEGPTSVERVKYVEGPEHGTSASNRRKGYMPPMNAALQELEMLPGPVNEGVNPYIHLEPPVYRIFEQMPNLSQAAIADIEKNGEGSEVVKEWRDAVWAEVSKTKADLGEPAYRPTYMKADSLAKAYGKMVGVSAGPSMSMFSSIDDATTLGVARQVLASNMEMTPGERDLVNRGVIASPADRMKDTQSTSPVASMVGSLGSMLIPGPKHNISKGMAKLENKAFKMMGGHADDAVTLGGRYAQAGKRAAKAGAIGAGSAGLMELGEAAVEAIGRQQRGERHADIGSIGARMARSAVMGGMFGSATDLLGRAGTWAGNALRTADTDLARRINSLEAAEGIDTATGLFQGLEATPKHKALKREQVADLGTPASARGPHDRLELEHKGPLGQELDRLADKDMAPLRLANKQYYNGVGAPRMSMVGLYKSLRRIADDKESVPFVREQLKKHIKAFEHRGKPSALPGGDRIEWGAPVRGEVPGIRRMNAQELDEAVAGIDDILNMGTAKGGTKSPALMEAQAELRRMYDSWGPAADGRKWSDVKADHHQVRNRVEARAQRFGNAGLATGGERKYSNAMGEAESNNLLNAVRASGTDANRFLNMLDDLKENKPLARWLTEQRAITAKQGEVGEVGGHISAPLVGDRKGAGIASIGLEAVVTRGVDPIFTLMSKLNGRAGNAARMQASTSEVGPMGALEMQALASEGKLWTYGETKDLIRAAQAAQGKEEE